MAPIFADTFDDYSSSTERWIGPFVGGVTYGSTSAFMPFPALPGFTAQGMKVTSQAGGKVQTLPANYPRLIFGIWVYVGGTLSGVAGIFAFGDGGYSNLQTSVGISPTGAINVYRGGSWSPGGFGGNLIANTGPGVVSLNSWHFIEIDVTFNASTGSVSLWLDAAQGAGALLTATGIDTVGTAHNYANALIIGDLNYLVTGLQLYFKDLYLIDNTGSAPTNAQMGMCRGFTKVATAAGDLTNWTPNGASANYQCTNNEPPNDSVYVSAGSTIEDTYTMRVASLAVTPLFVMGRLRAWMDDAGPHSIQHVVRRSSTDALGTAVTLSATPTFFDTFFPTDPSTSAAWTAAGADAAQSGQYRTT